jgi:WD40 repeat protein
MGCAHRGAGADPGGAYGPVSSVAFSPDGRLLASGSDDQTVILWDVRTGERVRTLTGHTGPVRSVAFSPDGRLLASGSEDQTVILWDVGTGERVRTLTGHTGPVRSVAFSPDGRLLASGSWDQDGDPVGCAHRGAGADPGTGHTDAVRSVAFSPDGRLLASGSEDQTVILWDVRTGERVRTLDGAYGTGAERGLFPGWAVVGLGVG